MQKKGNWLKISLSSEYEQTEFNEFNFNEDKYDGRRSINTFRTTVWLNGNYRIFKKKFILSHESYFQPSKEESDNYRWQADLGLAMPIWKFLNFKINYRHTFESIVIAKQKREDRFLTFGFSLKSL